MKFLLHTATKYKNVYSPLPYSHSFCPDTNWGFDSISGQFLNKIQVWSPAVSNENQAQPLVDLHRDQQATLSSDVS